MDARFFIYRPIRNHFPNLPLPIEGEGWGGGGMIPRIHQGRSLPGGAIRGT